MLSRLSDFRPNLMQLDLLRSCLLSGPPALAAWKRWKSRVDLSRIDDASFRLWPLLAHNLHKEGIGDPDFGLYRGAQRRSWMRNQQLFFSLRNLLDDLRARGWNPYLLKGVALATSVYPNAGLRPMHDLDIWLPAEQAAQAADWLTTQGWSWQPHPWAPGKANFEVWSGFNLEGPNQLPIDLHGHILNERCLPSVTRRLTARPRLLESWGCATLGPSEQLLHVLVHGLHSGESNLRWWADAHFLIHHPQWAPDWNQLAILAREFRLSWTVATALRCLEEQLQTPVPVGLAGDLEKQADGLEKLEFRRRIQRLGKLGALPQHGLRYLVLSRLQGRWANPLGGLDYLRQLWGLEGYAAFPGLLYRHLRGSG